MSILAARLGRLTPVLTARERAAVVIQNELAGQEPDPDLRRSMPREQLTEFNRYLALYYIANAELATVCLSLSLQAELLIDCTSTPRQLEKAAAMVAEETGEELKTESRRARRKRSSLTVPQFLLGLAQDVREGQRRVALYRWKELRAIEIVWDEIAAELGCDDVLHPSARQMAETAKEKLRSLIEAGGTKRRKPPGPDEAIVEHYRQLAQSVLRTFQLLEAAT